MNPTTANGNDEWQTAGKTKSKPKPKPPQSSPSVDSNVSTLSNGYASGDGGAPHINNNHHYSNQNGLTTTQNGSGSNRRSGGGGGGGRQSSSGGGGSYNGGSKMNQSSNYTTNNQHSRPTSSKEEGLSKRKLLEKEAKNLAKHDATIAGKSFNDEIERSRDRVHQAFAEMRNQLNERERALFEELEKCKKQGNQMLSQRDQRAKEMKSAADNSSKMNDRQMDDLRTQIRRFVTEKRFEDDMNAPRFRADTDRLIEAVKNFGEVVAIGSSGGAPEPQKHSSMSSLVSSVDGGDGLHIGSNKAVSEIAVGGIMMKSDSMDADQLVELTRSLRENLKLQGIAEDILPEVCGASPMLPARPRKPPSQAQRNGGGGRGDGSHRNGGGYQRR